jgi:hypothetical protein
MRGTRANRNSEPSGGRERRSLSAARVAVMALVLLTILPPAGTAAPSRDPAVNQYVESVPGTGGDRAPGSERRSGGEPLPPDVRSEIERSGGEDVEALEAVASSPALGAPRADRGDDREARAGGGSDGPPSTIDAVASAAASGDGDAGGWLVGGLALLTAALAAFALARRRSPTR